MTFRYIGDASKLLAIGCAYRLNLLHGDFEENRNEVRLNAELSAPVETATNTEKE